MLQVEPVEVQEAVQPSLRLVSESSVLVMTFQNLTLGNVRSATAGSGFGGVQSENHHKYPPLLRQELP